MNPVWKTGSQYFAVVFAFGFAFGIVRTLWVTPNVGERTAELLETPLMLTVIIFASRWTAGRLHGVKERLQAGGIALALLLGAEIWFVLRMRDLTLEEYIAQRDPLAGSVYLLMLALFAVAPALWGLRAKSSG